MNKYHRTLVFTASAIAAAGTLPFASLANATPSTAEAVSFPETGSYIADLTGADGATTTLAIAVDGDNVAAYATNGVDDEAYFSGTEKNGVIDLTSAYQDRVTATFDGTSVNGDLTMNDVAQSFTAPAVSGPAGLYTAELADGRASWVVRNDHSIVGTQDTTSRRDNRQLLPAPAMTYGTWQVDVNGTPTTAVPVTGDVTF